jgi:Spy/CpxP family protein refolding chaperone
VSYIPLMTKIIALLVAGMFATGAVFGGEHGDCTKQAGNTGKPACAVSLASLNLTSDQQTKMDKIMAEHHKAGCSEASEVKYMQEAKTVLTPEQYAKFEAQCKEHKGKTKTET